MHPFLILQGQTKTYPFLSFQLPACSVAQRLKAHLCFALVFLPKFGVNGNLFRLAAHFVTGQTFSLDSHIFAAL